MHCYGTRFIDQVSLDLAPTASGKIFHVIEVSVLLCEPQKCGPLSFCIYIITGFEVWAVIFLVKAKSTVYILDFYEVMAYNSIGHTVFRPG